MYFSLEDPGDISQQCLKGTRQSRDERTAFAFAHNGSTSC